MNSRERTTAQQKHTMQPLVYTVWFNGLVIIAGFVLHAYAPDMLASVGGGATVIAVIVVSVIVGYTVHMRRMRRVQNMPDEKDASSPSGD